jgi:hypothetical protein
VEGLKPKQSTDNEKQNIFVDVRLKILVVEPYGLIVIATLDKKGVITILSQINDKPSHVCE